MLPSIADAFQQAKMPVTVFASTRNGLVLVYTFASPASGFSAAARLWSSGAPLAELQLPRRRNLSSVISPQEAAAVLLHEEHDQGSYDVPGSYANLRTLERVLEAFRNIAGRRKILWMSADFPFQSNRSDPASMNDSDPAKPIAVRVWAQISSEDVAFYGVGALYSLNVHLYGAGSPSDISTVACGAAPGLSVSGNESSPPNVCHEELPGKCVTRYLDEGRHYYLLGFYVRGDRAPGWHKIQVKANRPGLKVRSRRTYYLPANKN